jgi:hypothetical protein
MSSVCTEADRKGLEDFVDYAVEIAHEGEKVFEEKLFALICQIPVAFMDELLDMLTIFEEELGALFQYVRAFAIERKQEQKILGWA